MEEEEEKEVVLGGIGCGLLRIEGRGEGRREEEEW